MTDEQMLEGMEEEYVDIFTLVDEETGEEMEFELLAEVDIDGAHYVALEPMDEALREMGQYVLLRMEGEGEDAHFVSFDDEEETFDKVAEFFDDLFFEDVDYDQE